MSRVVAVFGLLAAVVALCVGCSSSTSGHGVNGTVIPSGSSGASSSVAGSTSASSSGSGSGGASSSAPSSSASQSGGGADANWPHSVNFGSLPHPDMHCADAGEGGRVDVLKVVTADVTGDGSPEAIVRLECRHSASEWPDTVAVYSKTGGTPTKIGTLLTATQSSYATGITTSGSTVTVATTTWSSTAPGCCPDLKYSQTFTWNGSGFTAGARHSVLHPCGDTAFVTTATDQQGATGHSSFVLLFKNKLPQACTVRGYPGLDAVSSSGAVLAHATRTVSGFAGGAHSIATITVPAGGHASATVEWLNASAGGGSCTTAASVMATPANTTSTVTLPIHPTICGLQIHPTVAGSSGRS